MTVRIVSLHKKPANVERYLDYYNHNHMPLVQAVPGVRKIRVGMVNGLRTGGEAPYWLVSEVHFDDQPALDRALASNQMKAAIADLPNFTVDGQVTIMFCDTEDVPGNEAAA